MRRSAGVRTGAGAALRFDCWSPVFVRPSLNNPLKRVVSAIKRATRYIVPRGASIAGWDMVSGGAKKGLPEGRNSGAKSLYSAFSTSKMSSFVGRTR